MLEFVLGLVVGGVGAALVALVARRGSAAPSDEPDVSRTGELREIAARAAPACEESAYPRELLDDEDFRRGVAHLRRADVYTAADLVGYYMGANLVLACMAVEALGERDDDPAEFEGPLLEHVNTVGVWTRDFVLRTLGRRCPPPLIGRVFSRVDDEWADNRLLVQFLQDFLARQVAAGEEPTFGEHVGRPGLHDDVEELLEQLADPAAAALRRELETHRAAAVDVGFLDEFGRRLGDDGGPGAWELLDHRHLREDVERLRRTLAEGRRSMVLVGEAGLGKSATLAVLARRLHADGWTVFEAGASDLMAGQSYIGAMEGRLQRVLRGIGGRPRVLWIVPSFHELMWAGRHRHSPTSLLDMLFPHVESGELRLLGETNPLAFEQMLLLQPRLRSALPPVRMEPLGEADSVELVGEWSRRHALPDGAPALDAGSHREAVELARQYLGASSSPGQLLRLLDAARRSREQAGGEPRGLDGEDLLAALAQLTGLPRSVLDHDEALDLDGLRRFFEQRVLGQPEAVECLVDRVALIKAGLTDPGRPLGVFLFMGPTGTGKTELAKALAAYLFGSEQRMIRLDMSELQDEASLDRLLGGMDEGATSRALVDAIRHQPFSVVLLDEIEKAHPRAFSLFLQLFDDARLTDRRGRTADFRHAIVIMTSNLGGSPSTRSVGFRPSVAGGGDAALERVFAPEFVNRIDRVVRFQPLGRAIMRDILQKELGDALGRRGLRDRAWAVEWEESAVDFLLRKGFTPDLGARPLRRAVERYLLSPLAKAIVEHQYPAGEQFLFVRSDGRDLQVTFVDPDAPEEDGPLPDREAAAGEALPVERIVFDAHGTAAEAALLEERVGALVARVGGEPWAASKQAAVDAMQDPAFWESPGRFAVLGRIESMDRIEVATGTASSLLARLSRAVARDPERIPRALLGRLAQQVYVVEHACRDLDEGRVADAFLAVEAVLDPGEPVDDPNGFAARLVDMYLAWSRRRGMRTDVLEETRDDGDGRARVVLAVSGFGAHRILDPERGLHVLETPLDEGGRRMSRVRARVRVVAQPEEPAADPASARAQAAAAFAAREPEPRVVRRYREAPSPLVRDGVRGWKTGLLDRVLGGDFDVVG